MGEKEQGAARESNAPHDRNSGQSSGRSIPENSIEAGNVDGDGTLDEGPLSVVKTKTKSNQSNDRLGQEGVMDGSGGLDDDGDGMPEAAVESRGVIKKKPDGDSG